MKVVRIPSGSKFRYFEDGKPITLMCEKCEIAYGYEIKKDYGIYILHNEIGTAFKISEYDNGEYLLHGHLYEKNKWLQKIRKLKLKRIIK